MDPFYLGILYSYAISVGVVGMAQAILKMRDKEIDGRRGKTVRVTLFFLFCLTLVTMAIYGMFQIGFPWLYSI